MASEVTIHKPWVPGLATTSVFPGYAIKWNGRLGNFIRTGFLLAIALQGPRGHCAQALGLPARSLFTGAGFPDLATRWQGPRSVFPGPGVADLVTVHRPWGCRLGHCSQALGLPTRSLFTGPGVAG